MTVSQQEVRNDCYTSGPEAYGGAINPSSAERFMYKAWRPKGFFTLKSS